MNELLKVTDVINEFIDVHPTDKEIEKLGRNFWVAGRSNQDNDWFWSVWSWSSGYTVYPL